MDQQQDVAPASTQIAELEACIAELRHQVLTLTEALESRTLIGRATGLLAAGLKRPVDEAWLVMCRTSSYANVKVRDVARLLVQAHDGTPATGETAVATRILTALERATAQPLTGDG